MFMLTRWLVLVCSRRLADGDELEVVGAGGEEEQGGAEALHTQLGARLSAELQTVRACPLHTRIMVTLNSLYWHEFRSAPHTVV